MIHSCTHLQKALCSQVLKLLLSTAHVPVRHRARQSNKTDAMLQIKTKETNSAKDGQEFWTKRQQIHQSLRVKYQHGVKEQTVRTLPKCSTQELNLDNTQRQTVTWTLSSAWGYRGSSRESRKRSQCINGTVCVHLLSRRTEGQCFRNSFEHLNTPKLFANPSHCMATCSP